MPLHLWRNQNLGNSFNCLQILLIPAILSSEILWDENGVPRSISSFLFSFSSLFFYFPHSVWHHYLPSHIYSLALSFYSPIIYFLLTLHSNHTLSSLPSPKLKNPSSLCPFPFSWGKGSPLGYHSTLGHLVSSGLGISSPDESQQADQIGRGDPIAGNRDQDNPHATC